MADKLVEIMIPGSTSVFQAYRELGDGTHAPIVVRPSVVFDVNIAASAAISGAFDMSEFEGGLLNVGSAWTAGNMGFKISDTLDGTYDLALDDTGVPIQITTVNTGRAGWYVIPSKLFPAKYVKVWSKSAVAATETDVNQESARTMKVVLK